MDELVDIDEIIESVRRESDHVEIHLPDLAPHEQAAASEAHELGSEFGREISRDFGEGFAAKVQEGL